MTFLPRPVPREVGRDAGPMVLAGLLTLLLVFAGGVWVGKAWEGRAIVSRSSVRYESQGSVAAPSPVPLLAASSQTQLRCVNDASPRPYSREELESRWHVAKMYLGSAESAGLWNDRGRRAAQLATGILLEVLVCSER